MAVSACATCDDRERGEAICGQAEPVWYSVYGMTVRSDFRLPTSPLILSEEKAPDWVFRRMETASVPAQLDEPLVAEVRCQHGNIICVMHAGPTGTWIRHPSLATCHIHPGARHVDVYPEPSGNERTLGLMLAGQISILVLRELGYPCLHASAVVTGQGAVAFLGTHGQGKSTMAASFLRRGAALLTDDALPLLMREDGVYGGPALPAMKLWNETAVHTLDLAEELPQLMPNVDKKLFALDGRYAFAPEPARLRAIYVLDRYDPLSCGHDDIRIEELSQRESLTTLLAQTSWSSLVQPAQSAALFMFYARLVSRVPVRVLSFPNGHHSQDAVCARVLADLEV